MPKTNRILITIALISAIVITNILPVSTTRAESEGLSLSGIFSSILNAFLAAPNDYQSTVKTGGEIESKYMANGPYSVSVHEEVALQSFSKYSVYYPTELETSNDIYPVIVICNGTGAPLSKYPAVAKHFASWGFIVIGTEETYSWNAFGAEMCLRYLRRLNDNAQLDGNNSLFYGKVDFDNVGVVGHSQGSVGAINAITNTEHKPVYKTAVSISPTNKALAQALLWDYDATLVNIPILLLSGAGGGDDWVITGEQLDEICDDIPSPRIKIRRTNTAHGEMLYSANGYVAAWFMWQLKGDDEAAQAFTGETPEILSNQLYQDQRIELDQ